MRHWKTINSFLLHVSDLLATGALHCLQDFFFSLNWLLIRRNKMQSQSNAFKLKLFKLSARRRGGRRAPCAQVVARQFALPPWQHVHNERLRCCQPPFAAFNVNSKLGFVVGLRLGGAGPTSGSCFTFTHLQLIQGRLIHPLLASLLLTILQ